MDNARLEAVMGKWPELREHLDGFKFYNDGWRRYLPTFVEARREIPDETAHALVFRAMVEKLPLTHDLLQVGPGWLVTEWNSMEAPSHPTAFDALLAFWEART